MFAHPSAGYRIDEVGVGRREQFDRAGDQFAAFHGRPTTCFAIPANTSGSIL